MREHGAADHQHDSQPAQNESLSHHPHQHPHDVDAPDVREAHAPRGRAWHELSHLVRPHSHDAAAKVDRAMEASAQGMRTLWISLAGLGTTAILQAAVFALSGSVALLGDTIHNAADALTAVPLGIAFLAGRRAATPRVTHGFGPAAEPARTAPRG